MVQDVDSGDIEGISLIGFRLHPDSDLPELYSLLTYGAKTIPLVFDEQIIFFSSPDLAKVAYAYFDESIRKISSPPSSTLGAVCDIAEMLYILNQETVDESATIVNCLNIIFDLVKATKVNMPKKYKNFLYDFADHLTFNREFATYLSKKKLTGTDITNAVMWCIGVITVNSKIINS